MAKIKSSFRFHHRCSLEGGRRCNSFWGRIACSWYRRISHQYDSIFIVSSLPRYKTQHCWGRHKDEQTTHSTFGSGETHFFSARCIFHKVVRVYTHFYYLPCVLCSLGTSWGYPITSENGHCLVNYFKLGTNLFHYSLIRHYAVTLLAWQVLFMKCSRPCSRSGVVGVRVSHLICWTWPRPLRPFSMSRLSGHLINMHEPLI